VVLFQVPDHWFDPCPCPKPFLTEFGGSGRKGKSHWSLGKLQGQPLWVPYWNGAPVIEKTVLQPKATEYEFPLPFAWQVVERNLK